MNSSKPIMQRRRLLQLAVVPAALLSANPSYAVLEWLAEKAAESRKKRYEAIPDKVLVDAPCTGSGEPCYNTWFTCKAKAAFLRQTRDYEFVSSGPLPWPGPRPSRSGSSSGVKGTWPSWNWSRKR